MQAIEQGFNLSSGNIALHRNPKIFVSHISRDDAFVAKLPRGPEPLDADTWVDFRALGTGDSLRRCIEAALEAAQYVGAILTPAYVASDWCTDEEPDLRKAVETIK